MAPRYCTLLSWAASILVFACLLSLDEDIFLGEGLTLLDLLLAPSCTWYVATFVWSSATGMATLLFTSKKPTRGCATIIDKEQQCAKRPQTTKACKPKTASSNQEHLHGAQDVKTEEPVAHTEDKRTEETVDEQLEELTLATAGIEATVEDVGKGGLPESVEAKKENETENAPAPTKSGKKQAPPPPPKKKNDGTSSTKNAEENRLKPFYWKKLAPTKNSVWSAMGEPAPLSSNIKTILERLFCKDKPKLPAAKKKDEVEKVESKGEGSKKVEIVSAGRATMLGIMMRRYANFPGGVEGLCKAVMCGTNLADDDICIIKDISPSNEEVEKLKKFKGDAKCLREAEGVLYVMNSVVRFRRKCECILVMQSWKENLSKANEMLDNLGVACREVLGCERLRGVMGTILSVGNILNLATSRGKARGIKLESFKRLADTKATLTDDDRGIGHLLHFVAFAVKSTGGGQETQFLTSVLPVFAASRGLLDGSVQKVVGDILTAFEMIETEVKAIFGVPYPELGTMEQVAMMSMVGVGTFPVEERRFAERLVGFLRDVDSSRSRLVASAGAVDEAMRSVAEYFGESTDANPRPSLNILLDFVHAFDLAYDSVVTG